MFRETRPLNGKESFLEYETIFGEPPPGHVFVEILAEIDPRKVAEEVRRLPDKNNGCATHCFALSPKPIARFRWTRARLSLFRPQPHLPSFIQIHPSVRELLAKTTFQVVTIIGEPIDKYRSYRGNMIETYIILHGIYDCTVSPTLPR